MRLRRRQSEPEIEITLGFHGAQHCVQRNSIVGDTDLALFGRLRTQFKGYLEDGFPLGNPSFRIIRVGQTES